MTAKLVQAWTSRKGTAMRLVLTKQVFTLERQATDALGAVAWQSVTYWDLAGHMHVERTTVDLLDALLDAAAKREQLAKSMTYSDPQDKAV